VVREKRRYFLRGGSWNYDAPALQSAHRDGNYPSYTYYSYGFRLVREDKKKDYVIRGGAWNDFASNLQSAYRFDYYPGGTVDGCGFRLTREKI